MHSADDAISGDDPDRSSRPPKEPAGYTQEEQLRALQAEGDHDDVWFDMTEQEEARHLEAEYGKPTREGIYWDKRGEEP